MSEAKRAASTGVKIIKPPNTLQNRVAVAGDGKLDFDAIRRAEQALEKLSTQFDDWMSEEAARLSNARREFLKSNGSEDALEKLFHAAHDVKGQAPTLGYQLVAYIAASLCGLLEKIETRYIPHVLIDQHVDAVRAIVEEVGKDGSSKTGDRLRDALWDVTQDFIKQAQEKGHARPAGMRLSRDAAESASRASASSLAG